MSDAAPLTGGCLCGAVRYTLTAPIRRAVNCHCTRCRKISGAAFQTIFLVRKDDFRLDAGEGELSSYVVSEVATKHFCRTCGTAVYSSLTRLPKHVLLPLGSLDDPKLVTPEINIHCEKMLPWVKEIGAMPLYPRSAEEGPGE